VRGRLPEQAKAERASARASSFRSAGVCASDAAKAVSLDDMPWKVAFIVADICEAVLVGIAARRARTIRALLLGSRSAS
jgi:hypothetical protein